MTMDDTFDPLDELVSAYLDGEATPAERARVEADPELRARVDQLARIAGALRDVEIDPGERDTSIAAALAAFDASATETPAASSPTVLADVRAEKARRNERSGRIGRAVGWLGAAAAVGVAVIALNGGMGGDDEESAADTASSSPAEFDASVAAESAASADTLAAIEMGAEGGAAEMAAETTAAAAEDAATTAAMVISFETEDDLRAYVEVTAAEGRLAVPEAPPTTSGAIERYCTLAGGVPSVVVGPVVWQGIPGELVVSPDAAAPVRAVVLSADCTKVLVSVELGSG